MTSSSRSSKRILVFCFSFRVEASRASLTFVSTCRHRDCQLRGRLRRVGTPPPAQGYLLRPGQRLHTVGQVQQLPLAVRQLAVHIEGIGGQRFFLQRGGVTGLPLPPPRDSV